jgi:tRNA threonylcarbamoyladenosine biosynthesis protein TsaB
MKILAMDTSTLVMGVAVLDAEENRLLGEVTTNLHKNHSVRLMPTVSSLLEELELSLDRIGALAVTAGPGSYTGIRIAVTTAKTMAWARKLPLYSETSLKVLAMNGFYFDGVIVPMFDARRKRVYSGVFAREGEGLVEVIPQQVVSIEEWLAQICQLNCPVLFLGDDVKKFQDDIFKELGDRAFLGTASENIPRASQLAILAASKWKNHEPFERIDFAPNYLQLTEAEANWLKKQGNGDNVHGEKA